MRHDVACMIVGSPGGALVIASDECGAALRLVVSGHSARQTLTV